MMIRAKQGLILEVHRFLNCDSGVTSIEYAAIGGVMALVLVAVANPLGTAINAMFVAVSVGFH